MRRIFLTAIVFPLAFCVAPLTAFPQGSVSINDSLAMAKAVDVYHSYMTPESGLYDGSEYPYNVYYTVKLADSDPFFISNLFDTGAVFYNGMLYENVPLLYDIVQGEILIRDPTRINIIRLHKQHVKWFRVHDKTFFRLEKDSASAHPLNTGFYLPLYRGNTSLYMFASKEINESSSSFNGLKSYAAENDVFFIRKGNDYFRVKDKKSVLKVLGDKRKEVTQFIKKNKIKLRKELYYALPKVVAYYDGLSTK